MLSSNGCVADEPITPSAATRTISAGKIDRTP
jgi:hypothetical protein